MEAVSAPRPHALRIPKPRRLLSTFSDEKLVEHVTRGDAAAFEVLYDRHSAGLLGFCRHMLGSVTDAEDAVQHTFIAAHADIVRRGDRDLYVKAWLYTIARNRCLSMLRGRREQVADDDIEIVTDRFDHDVQQREDLQALLADVSKLPDDQREALVLAEVGDLSHDDISSVLGCEPNKVKSLVFQARTNLIDRRIARDTPCAEIREQLATLKGGALRRSSLRHHIEACPGCAEYREQIRRQRAMLALALPVVPSAALKAHVLGSVGLGGGTAALAGGAGATGTVGSLGFANAGIAKIAVAALLVAGGAGGAAAVNHGRLPLLQHETTSESHGAKASSVSNSAAATQAQAASTAAAAAATAASKEKSTGSHRSAKGTEHGFTPVTGESNGARARQFATTRGKGKHSGITKHSTSTAHRHAKHVKRVTPRAKATPAPQTHTQAPKSTAPKAQSQPKSSPTPQPAQPAPEPQSTPTTTTPVPDSGSGGGGGALGKTQNSGKRAATDITG